ncbi:MAG: type II toxin-antitoxin system RelE/ParE family toxin [Steroidobacteraceae bacterium]
MGSARTDLLAFPPDARQDAGYQLERVQRGQLPHDWKPISIVGSGVREIRIHESAGAFRVIYLASRPEGIYVLHCFQKTTEQTGWHNVALAKRRFKAISRGDA